MHQPTSLLEPWLRGTLTDTPAVQRAVMHALQAAEEELTNWCSGLTDEEVQQRPAGLASVAFHLRHIPGSIDRLLTYAEGGELSGEQLQRMRSEGAQDMSTKECLQQLSRGPEDGRGKDPAVSHGAVARATQRRTQAPTHNRRRLTGACG